MNCQLTTPNSEAAILGRLMEKRDYNLFPDAAKYFLSIRFEE